MGRSLYARKADVQCERIRDANLRRAALANPGIVEFAKSTVVYETVPKGASARSSVFRVR